MLGIGEARPSSKEVPSAQLPASAAQPTANTLPDLAPARWIWYPSRRCLANTFVLFRRLLELPSAPVRATGWISADSRYLLEVNGQRAQWGPAPCDPRWFDADPVDLTGVVKAGTNAIGATVLFYGLGDGTSPIGKPGFLFRLEIECADGSRQTVVSDDSWKALLARAWQPGHYKRWYLRSLQEEFDARLYPYGWTQPSFVMDGNWLPAMALECPPGKPLLFSNSPDYLYQMDGGPETSAMRARTIPPLSEKLFYAQLAESMWIEWLRPAEEYFECRPPNAFRAVREPSAHQTAPDEWQVQLEPGRSLDVCTRETDQRLAAFFHPCSCRHSHRVDAPGGPYSWRPGLVEYPFRQLDTFHLSRGSQRLRDLRFRELPLDSIAHPQS
jgi:hypothetical protein